jgi:hypothetical protein
MRYKNHLSAKVRPFIKFEVKKALFLHFIIIKNTGNANRITNLLKYNYIITFSINRVKFLVSTKLQNL